MTNLKTLKDLGRDTEYGEIVNLSDLRQEAIKWINELEKSVFPDRVLKIAQIDWIKHFFGISEDELNGK